MHSHYNICNIQIKHMQHPDETSEIFRTRTYNMFLKKLKHLEHTLATYVYSHCSMCNILIYFCNIQMKHLKHFKIYACNMCFQRNVTLVLG